MANQTKNKKYNLLIVVSGIYIGGAEKVAENIFRNIDKDMFNVSIACLKNVGEQGQELVNEGLDIFSVRGSKEYKTDYISFLKLFKVIKERKIDILHSHDLHSFIDSSMCKLLKPSIKLIHTFHYGNYPNISKKYYFLEKLFSHVPDRLVAVGTHQKQSIVKTYKIPENRIISIMNGVDVKPSNDCGLEIIDKYKKQGKIIIGSISTMIEQKGITYLIDTAKLLKESRDDFVFIVVGAGELKPELEKKVDDLGLNDVVIFAGWVTNAANTMLNSFDIFFQPSLWEAMSMVVLEAMALAKPVVVTDVGENNVVIEDGKNGYVVKTKDIQSMASALDLLVEDGELRKSIGDAAHIRYLNNYTSNKMASNYANEYLDLLNSRKIKAAE